MDFLSGYVMVMAVVY